MPSLNTKMVHAVHYWEQLRKGERVRGDMVADIYKYLGGELVARGHRTFKGGDPNAFYDLGALTKDHGLQSSPIWHEALTRIPEDKREYLIAVLRRKDRKSTRLNSSHTDISRMPSSA